MDSNRMETVKRVTSAITGAPARIAIRGARKIDARGVREHFWLTSADGVIAATGTDEEEFEHACRSIAVDPADDTRIIDAAGRLLTPGYVDIHAHGSWERSFDDGPEGIDIARAGHAVHGTTRQVCSLITNPIDVREPAQRARRDGPPSGCAGLASGGAVPGARPQGRP